jgi:uncharacterized protein
MIPIPMTLGLFTFHLASIPYQELTRQSQWQYPAQARVGARAARQFTGPGDDAITLQAILYPEFTGGQAALDLLRLQANRGQGWPLIEGTGRFLGFFVITGVDERGSFHFSDGTARRIEVSIALQRTDSAGDLLPALASVAGLLL